MQEIKTNRCEWCTLVHPKPGVSMSAYHLSEQTPQERKGNGRGGEPTPLMPLGLCVFAVSMAMALVQVSWAAPLLIGAVLLVVVATVRNGIEAAQETVANDETQAPTETSQQLFGPDNGQPQSPFQEPAPARAARRFKGDNLWGLN